LLNKKNLIFAIQLPILHMHRQCWQKMITHTHIWTTLTKEKTLTIINQCCVLLTSPPRWPTWSIFNVLDSEIA